LTKFSIFESPSITEELLAFLEIYRKRVIQDNQYGMLSVGNFYLWLLLRNLKPAAVIESGVWKGQSTWMIEQAVPHAQIISIDPELQNRVYISPNASYTSEDFQKLDLHTTLNNEVRSTVCFFDDHQNAFERVLQCREKGIKHLIFDDNYPPGFCDNRIDPHLSLRKCFEMQEHCEKAEVLKQIIKQYFIMPPIIEKVIWFTDCVIPALWQSLEDIEMSKQEKMRIFEEDSHSYRWMTYLELV